VQGGTKKRLSRKIFKGGLDSGPGAYLWRTTARSGSSGETLSTPTVSCPSATPSSMAEAAGTVPRKKSRGSSIITWTGRQGSQQHCTYGKAGEATAGAWEAPNSLTRDS